MVGLYEIKKGVPIPANAGLTGIIRKMEYMDSVDIPGDKLSSVHPCASQAGAKVKTKKNSDGTVTVWRMDRTEPEMTGPGSGCKSGIELTAANPEKGLSAGYYLEESPYGARIWFEGKPPAPEAKELGLVATGLDRPQDFKSTMDIFS